MNCTKQFTEFCKKGDLIEAKKYWNRYKKNIDIHHQDEKIFRLSCDNGHLNIAKWLLEICPDIHTDFGSAFFGACENGHLDVVKLLYAIGKESIYNGSGNAWTFCCSCRNEHLDVVKWLLENNTKIDIHTRDELAFRWVCEYRRIDIVEWLMTLCERYDYKNGKCIIYSYMEMGDIKKQKYEKVYEEMSQKQNVILYKPGGCKSKLLEIRFKLLGGAIENLEEYYDKLVQRNDKLIWYFGVRDVDMLKELVENI